MDVEVEPLFKPGSSLRDHNPTFLCNINDEISLWRVGGWLRAYTADGLGTWMSPSDQLNEIIALARRPVDVTERVSIHRKTLAKNIEQLSVYVNMLR